MDYGSHISLSLRSQPSVLEVSAQESLLTTLQPAFDHILKVVGAEVAWVGVLHRYCSAELFTILHALLQHHSLKHYGCSFSEHFYDLRRVDLQSSSRKTEGSFKEARSDTSATSTSVPPRTLESSTIPSHDTTPSTSHLESSSSLATSLLASVPQSATSLSVVLNSQSSRIDDGIDATQSSPSPPKPAFNLGSSNLDKVKLGSELPFGTLLLTSSNETSQSLSRFSIASASTFKTSQDLSKFLAFSRNIISKLTLIPAIPTVSFRVFSKICGLVLPTKSSHTRSLVVLVLLPYVYYKLTEAYRKYEEDEQPEPQSKAGRLRVAMLKLWPYVHTVIGIIDLYYYIRYLSGISTVCTLKHRLSGVTLRRATEDELETDDLDLPGTSLRERLILRASNLLMEGVEIGAFFLQFLDWWYSTDRSSETYSTSTTASAVVPPPPHDKIMASGGASMKDKCPICHGPWNQPTVLSVSGYVYCYSCIVPLVRSTQRCPVTGYPASTKQLIRLYQQ